MRTGRSRREYDATEMIPGGRNGRRSVAGRRRPSDTSVLEPAHEPSPAERITAALERHVPEAGPVAPPQPEQVPARQALAHVAQKAPADHGLRPGFTPAGYRTVPAAPQRPSGPASRPGPAAPGPVPFTGDLPAFAAVAAEMTLPSLLWCAGCGRDFTDDETAKYDRMLQFLHIRAAETGWRRDAHGLLRCPQCQQSQWMAAWCLPVLAGGIRAEVALREAVEGPLPARRRDFIRPPAEVTTFDGLPAEAVTVTRDDDGPRVTVDWKSVIARPKRAAGQQGGRHRKRPAPAMPGLSHYDLDGLSGKLRDGAP